MTSDERDPAAAEKATEGHWVRPQTEMHLSPYTVMLTINLEPIYGIILALLIFGEKEQMNVEFYIGAMIVFTVVLANGIIKNRDQIKNKIALKSKRKK